MRFPPAAINAKGRDLGSQLVFSVYLLAMCSAMLRLGVSAVLKAAWSLWASAEGETPLRMTDVMRHSGGYSVCSHRRSDVSLPDAAGKIVHMLQSISFDMNPSSRLQSEASVDDSRSAAD